MKRALLFLAAGAATSATPGNAQAPTEGARLAQAVCAGCHGVSADANVPGPDPKAPHFVDVAAMPSTTALSVKVFLRSSHKDMPNIVLDDKEIDAISSYILDLRKK